MEKFHVNHGNLGLSTKPDELASIGEGKERVREMNGTRGGQSAIPKELDKCSSTIKWCQYSSELDFLNLPTV